MANVNYERVLTGWTGSADGTADGLALKIFSGMVLEAFQQSTHFYDRTGQFISVKAIEGASSAQWPILGDDPAPSYHVAGQELNVIGASNSRAIKTSEATVAVDEILVNALDVPFRDLEIAHFDVIAPFATKLGRGIAKVLDKKIAVLGVKAARTAAVTNIHGGGYVVYRDDGSSTTSGSADIAGAYPISPEGAYKFRSDLASLAQTMDEKAVPDGSRFLFINPHIKSVLRFEAAWTGSAVSSVPTMPSTYDQNLNTSPNDVNNRVIGMLEGFKVVVTNHLPSADLTANSLTGENAAIAYSGAANTGGKYQGYFNGPYNATTSVAKARARPVALALCGADTGSPAIGMVQASGLRSYMEADERRNTQFMKAQMMCGMDIICPWSAGSIEVFRDG